MNYKSAIELLGLGKSFSTEDLQKRYKELAKKYHPDNSITGDEKKFMAVKEAYEFLLDKKNVPHDEKETTETQSDTICPMCNGKGWRREKIKTGRGYVAQKVKCSACGGLGRK